jgi:pimeloyl-ACP methyl ester carboxylesterase
VEHLISLSLLHPFTLSPTSSYILLNNLRFHYLNWGGDNQPLVLLHGLASSARIWDLVAPQLTEHFRVFALDQRNHGLTDAADDGFDFETITRDLHAYLETMNLERPILVGHSWGASTVLAYAASRSVGLFAPAAIVLVDGGLFAMQDVPGFTWEKAEAMLRPPELDGMPVQEFRARMQNFLPPGLYSEEVTNIILANFRIDEDEKIYRRLPIPKHMQIARAIYEKQTFELFARVRCPILLCPASEPPRDERGEQFLRLKQDGATRAAQTNPRVHTHWFKNTIHDVPLQRPAELAEVMGQFITTEVQQLG